MILHIFDYIAMQICIKTFITQTLILSKTTLNEYKMNYSLTFSIFCIIYTNIQILWHCVLHTMIYKENSFPQKWKTIILLGFHSLLQYTTIYFILYERVNVLCRWKEPKKRLLFWIDCHLKTSVKNCLSWRRHNNLQ